MGNLLEEIREAINRHSRENESNTPDYILWLKEHGSHKKPTPQMLLNLVGLEAP